MSGTDRRDSIDAGIGEGELLQLLNRRERNLLLGLATCKPAHVVVYNPADQTTQVLVGNLAVELTGLPVEVPEPPMPLSNVPVGWWAGMGGQAYDTIPLLPGDTGLLLCADRATEEWKRLGQPCDPVDARTHSLADCWFLPIARPTSGQLTPGIGTLLGRVIEAPQIQLGATATMHLVLAEQFQLYMVAFWTALGTAPLDGGATMKASALAYLASNPIPLTTATTKVTAE